MKLSDVKAGGLNHRPTKRRGRGPASGIGGTSGRGNKGFRSRSGSGTHFGFEGGQTPYFRRMPKRGFSNAEFTKRYAVVNVGDLNRFSGGDVVNLEGLMAKGLVKDAMDGVKILGGGTLEIALTVEAAKFSESAARKIREAGGEIKSV